MQHHNRQKSSTFPRDKEVRKIYTFTIPRESFDELNPDKQAIRQLISKHISMVDRLKKNMSYYEGKHKILDETKRENRLVCNHAKDISDTASSYFIGNPVTYKSEGDIKPLTDALELAGADETDGGIAISNITSPKVMLEQADQSGRIDLDDFDEQTIIDLFGKAGAQMLIIDAIIGNGDRHAGDFGWIRNTDTGEYVCMAPLYDFDHALDSTLESVSYTHLTLPTNSLV